MTLKTGRICCLEMLVRNRKQRRSHLSYLTSEGCNYVICYSHVTIYLLSLGQRMFLPYCHLYVCTVVDCLFVSLSKLQVVVVVRVGSSLKQKGFFRPYNLTTFRLSGYRVRQNVRVVVHSTSVLRKCRKHRSEKL